MVEIRLVTWNIHGAKTPPLNLVADLLRDHTPDVVVLQEVRHGQASRIAGLLGWPRPTWAFKHNGYWPLWWRAEGLAVLSPSPLAAHPPVLLTPGVSRRSHARRVALVVEVGTAPLLLVDVHLASGPRSDERARQARVVVGVLPEDGPAIVAGDLNATPDEETHDIFRTAGFADAWLATGGAPTGGHTNPANAPRQRIDYVLVRGHGTTTCEVLADLGPAMSGLSDHRPVLAVLQVPDVPADLPSHP